MIHAHRPVGRLGPLSMKKLGSCQPVPPGAGPNGEDVNGGAGETLRGEERLIGFVDHLSMKEEVGRDVTPQLNSKD